MLSLRFYYVLFEYFYNGQVILKVICILKLLFTWHLMNRESRKNSIIGEKKYVYYYYCFKKKITINKRTK